MPSQALLHASGYLPQMSMSTTPTTHRASQGDSHSPTSWTKRYQSWEKSIFEKRIHPDINSVIDAEEGRLMTPWDAAYTGMYMPITHPQGEASAIEGLHPRARPTDFRQEAHIRGDKGRTTPPDFIFGAASDIRHMPHHEKEPHHPPALLPSVMRYESSTSIARCSGEGGEPGVGVARSGTFGRRHHFSKKASSSSTTRPNDSVSDFHSVSTPSASSRSISQSRKTSTYSLPRTPKLFRHSPRSKPQYSDDQDPYCTVASPHTFGAPTPPRADISVCPSRRDQESYFGFREPPPPLPPLDHPALRESLQYKTKKWSNSTSSITNAIISNVGGQDRKIQPSPSLPSLRLENGRGITSKVIGGRGRSNSASTGRISTREAFEQHIKAGRVKHARTQSKSSVNSRRSSAEYSARQASSTHGSEHEECWEVQVSRAMVQLALGEGVQYQELETSSPSSIQKDKKHDANYGQARGKNRSTGEAFGLGSPFFLQDTPTHNLTSSQLSGNYSTNFISKFSYSTPKKTAGKVQDMSNGGATTAMNFSENGGHATREALRTASSSTAGSRRPRRISLRAKNSRTPSPPPPRGSLLGAMQGTSSLLSPPSLSVISATPDTSPISPTKRTHHKSQPTMPTRSMLQNSSTPPIMEKSYSSGSGKRKADEAGVGGDKTPPKERRPDRTTTFAPDPRTHRVSSTSSHAPSSYHNSKRVRLSSASASEGRSGSIRSGSMRFGTLASLSDSPPNAKTTGSWSSRGSHTAPVSANSHTAQGPPLSNSASYNSQYMGNPSGRPPSRRSLSQASIPISALVSPHAPSIARSGTYHMRDPRRPAPVQSTPWSLSFPSYVQEGESRWAWRGWVERGGSPLHAWLFFIGFVIFPLWWAAALFIPIPRTRRLPGTDAEKGVMLDDPQVEHDALSWRTRCRVMAIASIFTYIPFIVLVGIFA